jgi:hypothetical protein
MRSYKEKTQVPILYVADRVDKREDVVVLIVDILIDDKKQAEAVAKEVVNYLSSRNIKITDYKLGTIMIPFKEVWRLVAMVAVDNSQ